MALPARRKAICGHVRVVQILEVPLVALQWTVSRFYE